MADSPAPNRNVVSRRVAVKPRVEARTTEIDCSQFAKLVELEEATAKPVVDLDAEIEVVSSLPAGPETARGSARFAHTLPREAPEVPAPEALIPIPRITSEIPTLALQQLTRPPSDLPIETPQPEPQPRGSRGWIIFASVSVALALVALIFVLEL